jgi:hypothetical protein
MKSYVGYAHVSTDDDLYQVVVETGDRESHPLNPRFDLINHSPTGFCWGYTGSGPAQLALAILADHLGNDQEALELYHDFKCKLIARIPMKDNFTLRDSDVQAWVETIRRERSSRETAMAISRMRA